MQRNGFETIGEQSVNKRAQTPIYLLLASHATRRKSRSAISFR
jgi:hypothetical protein